MHLFFHSLDCSISRSLSKQCVLSEAVLLILYVDFLEEHAIHPLVDDSIQSEAVRQYLFVQRSLTLNRAIFLQVARVHGFLSLTSGLSDDVIGQTFSVQECTLEFRRRHNLHFFSETGTRPL